MSGYNNESFFGVNEVEGASRLIEKKLELPKTDKMAVHQLPIYLLLDIKTWRPALHLLFDKLQVSCNKGKQSP
jgi:hypothetical protein